MANTNKKRDLILSAVKLKDVGMKPQKGGPCCVPSSSSPKKYYPNLYLENGQAEDFAKLDVGKKIKAVISGNLVSKSIRDNASGKQTDVSLQIKEIGLANE